MRIVWLVLVTVILAMGCKGDTKGRETTKEVETTTEAGKIGINVAGVPDMCACVTPEILASILDKPVSDIVSQAGSGSNTSKSRSCFYKLLNQDPSNAGIMVGAEVNPMPDEILEFHSRYITSKKTLGENSMNSPDPVKYQDFLGIGDDGAYSYELSKYMWRVGEEITFTIAFNTDYSAEKQKKVAEDIGAEIIKVYSTLKKK